MVLKPSARDSLSRIIISICRFDNAPNACWRALRLRLRSALRSMVAWDFGAFAGRGLAGTGVGAGVKFGINKALLLCGLWGYYFSPLTK